MKEIEIPEGYEARIEGNKVIIEPKKSEDERIRKEIKQFILDTIGEISLDDKENAWLDWLEEQKHFWNPTEEDVTLFDKAVTTNTSLTPQDRAKLDIIRMKFKHRPNIEQKEQKPAQFKGENLAEIIKGEFEGFRRLLKKKGIDYEPQSTYWEDFARLFDSSAREYLKEQKPAEWSKEDENQLNWFYSLLDYIGKEFPLTWGLNEIGGKKWLKSLRPSWKPGKYILSLVKKVADGEILTGVEQMNMRTLHEKLKLL